LFSFRWLTIGMVTVTVNPIVSAGYDTGTPILNDAVCRLRRPFPIPGQYSRDPGGVEAVWKIYEWGKIYGKTYGTYEGGHHTIVTSDLDILHDIFVKKFEYFHARQGRSKSSSFLISRSL